MQKLFQKKVYESEVDFGLLCKLGLDEYVRRKIGYKVMEDEPYRDYLAEEIDAILNPKPESVHKTSKRRNGFGPFKDFLLEDKDNLIKVKDIGKRPIGYRDTNPKPGKTKIWNRKGDILEVYPVDARELLEQGEYFDYNPLDG
jgi:hypothetical protein